MVAGGKLSALEELDLTWSNFGKVTILAASDCRHYLRCPAPPGFLIDCPCAVSGRSKAFDKMCGGLLGRATGHADGAGALLRAAGPTAAGSLVVDEDDA